jgi:hypothetical protein
MLLSRSVKMVCWMLSLCPNFPPEFKVVGCSGLQTAGFTGTLCGVFEDRDVRSKTFEL